MQELNARRIAHMSLNEVWQLPDDRVKLTCDDGVIETYMRAIKINWFYWEVHRVFPDVPLKTTHCLDNKLFTPKDHMKMCSKVIFDAWDVLKKRTNLDELSRLTYVITNRLYNEIIVRLEEYVTSVSILDYLQIETNPKVKEINDNVKPTPEGIYDAYNNMTKVMMEEHEFKYNNVTRMVKGALVDIKQVHQSSCPRGYNTDNDGYIMPNPIMTGYVKGLNTLHDQLIESRAGSKALMFAKEPLQQTEYFNRRMRLSASNIQNLHLGDCGTKQTVKFHVTVDDLESLQGKYYYDENDDLQVITMDSTHLHGKVIKMRSPGKCEHPDPYGICGTCMGQIAQSIPYQSNLGHISATAICSVITQMVLSAKHLVMSSIAASIHIPEYDLKYIHLNSDKDAIKINDKNKFDSITLVLDKDSATHIEDIKIMDSVDDLVPGKVTKLDAVIFKTVTKGVEVSDIINVSTATGSAHLTHEMLKYMREYGWDQDELGNYTINLDKWDFTQPAFKLPLKDVNMLEYMFSIATVIESSLSDKKKKGAKGIRTLTDYDSFSEALRDVHVLVSDKVTVNIAHLEILLTSAMIRDSESKDHRLPLPGMKVEFGKYADNIELRSLAPLFAYQGQDATIKKPMSYVINNRPDHPMDNHLMGNVIPDKPIVEDFSAISADMVVSMRDSLNPCKC